MKIQKHASKARRRFSRLARRLRHFESLESRQMLTGDVVINEFVASNDSTLETIAGKTPDWIELHNRSEEAVDLTGWHLRDSSAAWTVPAVSIDPHGYLIVFASGDDFVVTEPRLELHTNFKLKAGGEYLGLMRADGSVAHEFNPFPEQSTDQSYGLSRGESFSQYFSIPTPGAENPQAPQIVMSEIMASNQSTLADDDGDFPDWIEIYNASSSPANLNGWTLESDDIYWEFPEVTLDPEAYLLVFASGNDRRNLDAALHTNFKLGSDYDDVSLNRPDFTRAHRLEYPQQRVDVSYGLTADLAEIQYFASPTPGAPNLTGFAGVRFSPQGGIYRGASVTVQLSTESTGAVIRYTTDGSQPDESSPVYSEPFSLDGSATVTATVFVTGGDPVTTRRNYILENDIRSQSNEGKPQTWGFVSDYEMDSSVRYEDWVLSSSPSVFLTVDGDDLFSIDDGIFAHPVMDGEEWHRPVDLEFIPAFHNSDSVRMSASGLIRTTGRDSERNPAVTSKFSMEVEFSEPLEVDLHGHQVFANDISQPTSDQYFGMVLRAGHADSWLSADSDQRASATYARSWFVRASQKAMGQPALESNPVNVFINNMYWGIYDLTDRPSAEMAAEQLGGKAENYDVIGENGVIDGDSSAWDTLLAAAKEDLVNPDAYEAVASQIDLENLIDFIVLKRFAEIDDHVSESWFAARHRNRDEGFKFIFNDNAESLDLPTDATVENEPNPFYAPEFIFEQLMRNASFKRMFADRAQMHTSETGALSVNETRQRWYRILDRVTPVYLEAARWGDYRLNANPSGDAELYSAEEMLQGAYAFAENYFQFRSEQLLEELLASDEYPGTPTPEFITPPGFVVRGHRLQLRSNAGVVYYTVDGSDPANPDGSVSESAQLFRSSIRLKENTLVRARTLDGQQWSAIKDGTYLMTEPVPLKITEIMYHPALDDPNSAFDDDDFEFIEIKNDGEVPLDLTKVAFDRGISFEFKDGDVKEILPGQYVLVVKNESAFASRYQTDGLLIAGEFDGQLGNGGEPVELSDSFGQTIQQVRYLDTWYPQSDGEGFSLARSTVDEDEVRLNGPRYWSLSNAIEGTPGIGESQLPEDAIVISEVMVTASADPGEWIELHNTTNQTLEIGGWFLSDDISDAKKFQIPIGTDLQARGFVTFTGADDFGNEANPNSLVPFEIDDEETLYLSSGDGRGRLGGYRQLAELPATFVDVSLGRIVTASGTDYAALASPTRNAANSLPLVGPIVINEIMFAPADGGVEFIEIINISDEDVPLFAPGRPTDAWKLSEGIKFTFPDNAVLPARGTAVIAKADPVIFKERAGVPDAVQVFGPFKGALRNQGESVSLRKAWVDTATNETHYTAVDRVEFDDATPWPTLASIGVSSLQRVDVAGYGNDAANWAPSVLGGTPGTENVFVDSSPQSVPMIETFTDRTIDQLKGWTFSSGPESYWNADGARLASYVQSCRSCSFEDAQVTATLAVEVEDPQDLAFLMELEEARGNVQVEVSEDRRVWHSAFDQHVDVRRRSQTIAIDIGAPMIENGMDGPGTRYIRIKQQAEWSYAAFQSIGVINQDVVGPWVQSYNFRSDGQGMVDALELTFDEEIAPETMTQEAIQIRNPVGRVLKPISIATEDGQTWSIGFAPQSSAGTFSFTLDPTVTDLSGNQLNRFEYSINKRSPENTSFEATTTFDSAIPQAIPYEADFVSRIDDWSFAANAGAQWQVSFDRRGPHLRLSQNLNFPATSLTSTADLPIDLTGLEDRDDLSLDFWASGRASHITVAASNAGEEWQPLYGINLSPNFRHYAFDLDEMLHDLGITFDETVRLRFEHASSSLSSVSLDDIRIGMNDVFGPTVVSVGFERMPNASDVATVMFDEPIDQASMSLDQIVLRNPVGQEVAVDSILALNDQTFEIRFPSQKLAGTYRLTVGPNLTDLLGNSMNQDDSPLGGESVDTYSTAFDIPLEPTTEYPYEQDFSDDLIESLEGWSFSSTSNGEWSIRNGSLQGLATGVSRLEAELNLDLREHATEQRVSLQFAAKSRDYSEASVFVGSDQGRWFWVTDIRFGSGRSITHSVDLKQALERRGLSLTDDVKLLFRVRTHATARFSIDDVRVNGEEVFGPRVISSSAIEQVGDETSKISLRFDVPVDASSFTTNDVSLSLTGGVIRPSEVRQTGPTAFDLFFSTPAMAGLYNLNVGPEILGTSGIPMNQTNDAFSGLEDDFYVGTVLVEFEPVAVPYSQEFLRSDITSLAGWMFHTINQRGTRAGGEWRITGKFNPYGEYHLQQTQFADCWSQHDGILALDVARLAGSTDLVLEFDMRRTTTSQSKSNGGVRNMGQLMVGSSTTSFAQVGGPEHLIDADETERFGDLNRDGVIDLVPEFDNYVHYKFDLDELLKAGGVEVDGTIYVNFHRLAFYSSDVTVFDNIRVYDSTQQRVIGDANLDGVFNSRDLVLVFQANEYEDGVNGNSSWSEGDWNGDGDFTSADLVEAFRAASYTDASTPAGHRDSLFDLERTDRRSDSHHAAAAVDSLLDDDEFLI